MTQLALERWFRQTNKCLASANVIITEKRWGNPSVFPSVVCVFSVYIVCLIMEAECVLCQVASELAHLECLCVGIVSGLSGHCIPDMWYIHCCVIHSYQHLLTTSAGLGEVWATTCNLPYWTDWTRPRLQKNNRDNLEKPGRSNQHSSHTNNVDLLLTEPTNQRICLSVSKEMKTWSSFSRMGYITWTWTVTPISHLLVGRWKLS